MVDHMTDNKITVERTIQASSADVFEVLSNPERHVALERPIAVHLVYRTVFADAAGAIQHRFDVYGRDASVWRALEAEGVTLPAAQG